MARSMVLGDLLQMSDIFGSRVQIYFVFGVLVTGFLENLPGALEGIRNFPIPSLGCDH
jgi:hypothetical protein